MIPFAVSFGFRVMDALRGVQLLGLASVARAVWLWCIRFYTSAGG